MGAITDLWKSERGLLALLLVISAGVLAVIGQMPVTEWTDFSKWIFLTYTAGKSLTGAVQIIKGATSKKVTSPDPASVSG